MRIKNISSTTIKIPEFELLLKPGDEGDLSKIDPKELSNHPTLTSYFQKGLLVNLGFSKALSKKSRLNSTRDKINKLKGNDFVIKEKSSRMDLKKELKKAERKETTKSSSLRSEIERYKTEYFQNSNPLSNDSEFLDEPKPRVKVQEKLPPLNMQIDGNFTSTKSSTESLSGIIYPREIVGDTTFLAQYPLSQENPIITDVEFFQKNTSKIKIGSEEVEIDLDRVTKRIKSLCLGTTFSGKPCSNLKIEPFDVCFKHMTDSEKQQYKKSKSLEQEIENV